MPKMKTNRAAAKRFRKTGSGKFAFNRTKRRHLLTHKRPKQFRRLEKITIAEGGIAKQIRRLVPYL